jgi:hypothetical protein
VYKVVMDKVTGIMAEDFIPGAYKSRKRFKHYFQAQKHADRIQDAFNAQHNSGVLYFPYWEQRIVEVAA